MFMFVCMFVHKCMLWMHVTVCAYMYMTVHMCECVHTWVYMNICVCIYVCGGMCACDCIHIFVCLWVYACAYVLLIQPSLVINYSFLLFSSFGSSLYLFRSSSVSCRLFNLFTCSCSSYVYLLFWFFMKARLLHVFKYCEASAGHSPAVLIEAHEDHRSSVEG